MRASPRSLRWSREIQKRLLPVYCLWCGTDSTACSLLIGRPCLDVEHVPRTRRAPDSPRASAQLGSPRTFPFMFPLHTLGLATRAAASTYGCKAYGLALGFLNK